MLLPRRLAATLAPASPEHVDQPVVGGFQFRHPLAERVTLVDKGTCGVYQRFMITAKGLQLLKHLLLRLSQLFVASLTLAQLFQ